MSMYPTITVITDTMTAKGIFLQGRGRHTHTQRTSCYPFLCPVLLQILSGSTIDCSQVNPQTHSSCTALGKAAGNPGQLPPSLTVQV